MQDDTEQRQSSSAGMAILLAIVLPIALLFLPLLLAAVESVTLGSRHVEDLCRSVGIHDFLSAIYRPTIRLFGG